MSRLFDKCPIRGSWISAEKTVRHPVRDAEFVLAE